MTSDEMVIQGARRLPLPSGGEAAEALTSYLPFGFKVTPLTLEQFLDAVSRLIGSDRKGVFASQNVHALYYNFKHEAFRRLHETSHVLIDGTPIVWLARLAGAPIRLPHRVAWIDMFWPLMNRAESEGWRVFYLGGAPEILSSGIERVESACPRLSIAAQHGYFDIDPGSRENADVVDMIERFAPDILIVGMGMPRQETWILQNLERLNAKAVLTSGACIEVIAGALPTPPRWMGRVGLEWVYRLLSTPRRCAHRYLVEPWVVLWLLLVHNLGSKGRI